MPSRKAFLLRIDPAILDAIQNWADDDLRSLNGQIEFLLRKALQDAKRARPRRSMDVDSVAAETEAEGRGETKNPKSEPSDGAPE